MIRLRGPRIPKAVKPAESYEGGVAERAVGLPRLPSGGGSSVTSGRARRSLRSRSASWRCSAAVRPLRMRRSLAMCLTEAPSTSARPLGGSAMRTLRRSVGAGFAVDVTGRLEAVEAFRRARGGQHQACGEVGRAQPVRRSGTAQRGEHVVPAGPQASGVDRLDAMTKGRRRPAWLVGSRWYRFPMEAVIDRAGRIVLPKPIRDALGLLPGTRVDISAYGAGVQVVPTGRTARLVEEAGVLVSAGDTPVDDDVVFALIDAGRT